MISLFHGGADLIEIPEIREPNRTLDFGKGFYLTSSANQARDWVKRRINSGNLDCGYVNEYLVDFDVLSAELNVKAFDAPNDEWLDFVMNNRQNPSYSHSYDVVKGPVANDRVYTAFALYEGGTISREILIAELKTYRLVDQYLFHTEESLQYLKFINAIKIKL